jgi:WhiB family transcriptional regulator, redox-sensing transcriptional regulator
MGQPTTAEPEWYEYAACQGQGWEAFFDDPDPVAAQQTCAACPVRVRCLRFALANQIDTGIWGGLTPEQRRRVRASSMAA